MENIVTQSLGTHSLIEGVPPTENYVICLIYKRDMTEVCRLKCTDKERAPKEFPLYLNTYYPEIFAFVSQSGADNFGIWVGDQDEITYK